MKLNIFTALCMFVFPAFLFAAEKEYRPGGKEFVFVWNEFNKGNHEPELPIPLIKAGNKMTLIIYEFTHNVFIQTDRGF